MLNDANADKYEQLKHDLYLFNNGEYFDSYHTFGNKREEGGVRFTVWAPKAQQIAIVGDFNDWHEENYLEKIGETGSWTGVVANAQEGQCYKYKITQADGTVAYKIDPYALEFEVRPKDASIVKELPQKNWEDVGW